MLIIQWNLSQTGKKWLARDFFLVTRGKKMSEGILGNVSRPFLPAVNLTPTVLTEALFPYSSVSVHSWPLLLPHLFLLAEEWLSWCDFGWGAEHTRLNPFLFLGSGEPSVWSALGHMVRLACALCDSMGAASTAGAPSLSSQPSPLQAEGCLLPMPALS